MRVRYNKPKLKETALNKNKHEHRRHFKENEMEIQTEQKGEPFDEDEAFKWYGYRKLVLTGISIAIVAVVLLLGYLVVYHQMIAPVNAGDHTECKIVIKRGSSLIGIANQLENENIIRSSLAFRLYVDFSNKASMLQPGLFTLEKSMTMEEILDRLVAGGEVIDIKKITIVEGTTVEELADQLLKENVILDKQEFLKACKSDKHFDSFTDIKPEASSKKIYAVEGYLFPDTYEFYVASTPETVINKLLDRFTDIVTSDMIQDAQDRGMTLDQLITLASVIEKEANATDFYKVSAVFHNRLKKNMMLESDATVKYITKSDTIITTTEEMSVDSPYNTYKVKGLPAGPICSVSKKAIEAALNPDEAYVNGGYLYFVLTDPEKGELKYSKTLEEHKQAVAQYKPLWEAYDKAHSKQAG